MKIKVERRARKSFYTVGRVYVDGRYFCDSMEYTDRGVTQVMPFTPRPAGTPYGYWTRPDGTKVEKIHAKTAIPTGLYDYCSFWWPKHKCWVVMLQRVGGFTGILMHNGVNEDHSSGCILLGKNTIVGRLDGDRVYMDAQTSRVMTCEKTGEKVTVEVV